MADYTVKITPQAKEQMSENFRYIGKSLSEPETALKLLSKIKEAVFSLETMPNRVALTEEEPWHSRGIHKMPVQNFIVYFVTDEGRKEVHVIAVIYGKRNQYEVLKEINN
ncbi:MAG: type II toxin-antitoxin system RelE/ParE family toxin [Clostridia bacterium]|nr:type II toxin-antitoxin system RelE/ParE family toxin [Clostridia bacterium]